MNILFRITKKVVCAIVSVHLIVATSATFTSNAHYTDIFENVVQAAKEHCIKAISTMTVSHRQWFWCLRLADEYVMVSERMGYTYDRDSVECFKQGLQTYSDCWDAREMPILQEGEIPPKQGRKIPKILPWEISKILLWGKCRSSAEKWLTLAEKSGNEDSKELAKKDIKEAEDWFECLAKKAKNEPCISRKPRAIFRWIENMG